MFHPDREEFQKSYQGLIPQVVYTRLVADLETPVSAMLKLSKERDNCFLLESVEGGAARARYSIIGIDPDIVFKARGNNAEINHKATDQTDTFEPCRQPTLDAFERSDQPIPR